jgi:hypothetical protein
MLVDEEPPHAADGIDKVRRKFEHLRIAREQAENERRQREMLADLYDEQVGKSPSGPQTGVPHLLAAACGVSIALPFSTPLL